MKDMTRLHEDILIQLKKRQALAWSVQEAANLLNLQESVQKMKDFEVKISLISVNLYIFTFIIIPFHTKKKEEALPLLQSTTSSTSESAAQTDSFCLRKLAAYDEEGHLVEVNEKYSQLKQLSPSK